MIYDEDDHAGGSIDTIDEGLALLPTEVERADVAVVAIESLDEVGRGHGRPLGAS